MYLCDFYSSHHEPAYVLYSEKYELWIVGI